MTTRTEAKDILLKEFLSSYQLGYPVAYENNEDFTKPTDSPWIRFIIKYNPHSSQVAFGEEGRRKFERLGIIAYQVYIPLNVGSYNGNVACDHINDIFEGNRFTDIYCEGGNWSEQGVTNDEWFQFNGTIFFNFDEIK